MTDRSSLGEVLESADPVMAIHVRVGRNLAESAFREFGADAEERHLFGIERLMHPVSDEFMTRFGASEDQKLHAKIIIGAALRARYAELCRPSSVRAFERVVSLTSSNSGAPTPDGRDAWPAADDGLSVAGLPSGDR